MAASESPDFESVSIWPSTEGMICQDSPNLSFNQPHGPSSPPPAISLLQYLSISACVSQVTISEKPSANENVGPPSNAVYSRPSSWKTALSTLPLAMGASVSLSTRFSTFEFGNSET